MDKSYQVFHGYAEELRIGQKVYREVFLEFSLAERFFKACLPVGPSLLLEWASLSKDFSKKDTLKNVEIKNVEIYLPGFKLKSEKLVDLFISKIGQATADISQSFLGLIFKIPENTGYLEIYFKPKNFYFEFTIEPSPNLEEILIENFELPLVFFNVKAFEKELGFFPFPVNQKTKTIAFRITHAQDKEGLERFLRISLSYAQGKEVNTLMTLYENKVKIYFNSLSEAQIFPLIPQQDFENYLYSFYKFWKELSSHDKDKWERIILSVVYAKGKRLNIENSLANYFLALEILTEGRIEKNILRKTLNIPPFDAKFLTELRNKIIHGYSIDTAIEEAFKNAERELKDKGSLLFQIYQLYPRLEKFERTSIVYFALLDLLNNYILATIQYKGSFNKAVNTYWKEYLHEILIEDNELLETLANR